MTDEQLRQLRELETEILACKRLAMTLLGRVDAAHEQLLDLLNAELAGPLTHHG